MPKTQQRAPAITSPAVVDFHVLKRPVLAILWQATFGRPLSPGIKQPLAAHLLRFHRQETTTACLTHEIEAYLASLLPKRRASPTGAPSAPSRRLKPGTRLLRTWHGTTYTVTAADPGFVYAGKTYGSLSVIAREITGTAWSGPVFFGLKKTKPSERSA